MPTINNPYVNPVDLNNTAPKVHASQHRKGGSDPLTPADIGAAAENHTHEVSGLTVAWEEVTNKPAMFPAVQHAATHGSGGGDPLAIDASQITTGTVPLVRLPHGCLERLVIVQDDTARYALTTADVQQGDTVKVVETSTMYFVVDETKLDSPDGYVAYTAGAASAVDWSAITGKPDTFPPSAHTHTAAQITDFASAVDQRLSQLGISVARMLPAGFAKQETTVNFPGGTASGQGRAELFLGTVNGYLASQVVLPVRFSCSSMVSMTASLMNGDDVLWTATSNQSSSHSVTIRRGIWLTKLRLVVTLSGSWTVSVVLERNVSVTALRLVAV